MHGVHATDLRGHRVCAPPEYPASGHEGTDWVGKVGLGISNIYSLVDNSTVLHASGCPLQVLYRGGSGLVFFEATFLITGWS